MDIEEAVKECEILLDSLKCADANNKTIKAIQEILFNRGVLEKCYNEETTKEEFTCNSACGFF